MSKSENKTIHQIKHEEHNALLPCTLEDMSRGDIFVRHGAPHTRVEVDSQIATDLATREETVWIVNLLTGRCWRDNKNQLVYPATDVKLIFKTTRRD